MTTFCEEILNKTKEKHIQAENSLMMKKYIDRKITLQEHIYVLLLQEKLHLALEAALTKSPFNDDFCEFLLSLNRSHAIKQDLQFYGENKNINLTLSPNSSLHKTNKYIQYLSTISDDRVKLLAHAYVQYRAILNGGYALKNIVKRLINNECGTQFYTYEQAGYQLDKSFKDKMNAINNIDKDYFIKEVQMAYQLTTDIYECDVNEPVLKQYARSCVNFWNENKNFILPAMGIAACAVTAYSLASK